VLGLGFASKGTICKEYAENMKKLLLFAATTDKISFCTVEFAFTVEIAEGGVWFA